MASTVASPNAAAAVPSSSSDPSQLFTDPALSNHYALHRPRYPQLLYDTIYRRALPGRLPPFPDLTVADIATGSGQALGPLPHDFGTCIALDASAAQLAEFPSELRQRVQLRQGDAHATGLPPSSVDLVCVGQALHWFRLDDFYKECRRVLRPSGALAAWTYDFGELRGFSGAQQLYEQLHSGTLGPFWAKGRDLVDRHYEGIEPGPQHFEEAQLVQMPLQSTPTLEELVGYIKSWSAYRAYMEAHPAGPGAIPPDPAEQLRQEAARRMAAERAERLELHRTVTLLLAVRPKPL